MGFSDKFRAYAARANVHYQDVLNSFTYMCQDDANKQMFIDARQAQMDFSTRSIALCLKFSPTIHELAKMAEKTEYMECFSNYAKAFVAYFDDEWAAIVPEDNNPENACNQYLYADINFMVNTAKKFVKAYDGASDGVKNRLDGAFSKDGLDFLNTHLYYSEHFDNAELRAYVKDLQAGFKAIGLEFK